MPLENGCLIYPSWVEYYKRKPLTLARVEEIKKRHRVFLNHVIDSTNEMAIEVGVGTGALGYSLYQMSSEQDKPISVIDVDIEPQFLMQAKKLSEILHFVNCDTFSLPFSYRKRDFITIFHQGLLEHFSNHEVVGMIDEQLCVASRVIVSAPSKFYSFQEGLRGDERLMDCKEWIDVLSQFDCTAFYYGENPGECYHVCLTIRRKSE